VVHLLGHYQGGAKGPNLAVGNGKIRIPRARMEYLKTNMVKIRSLKEEGIHEDSEINDSLPKKITPLIGKQN